MEHQGGESATRGHWDSVLMSEPSVTRPSIFKRDQRFTFLHDSSHFSNVGSIVLFAACKGYISNTQIN